MTPMSNLSLYAPAFMHVYTHIHTYMHTIYISKCAHTHASIHIIPFTNTSLTLIKDMQKQKWQGLQNH